MLSATDSFIEYLNAGLNGAPPIVWTHASSDDAASSLLQMDTLNVSILGYYESGRLEMPLVSLDLLGSDERTVLRWTQTLRDLLMEQQYIPEMDFDTDPDHPTPVGNSVYWDAADIDFKIIQSSPRAVHMNATFELFHVRRR